MKLETKKVDSAVRKLITKIIGMGDAFNARKLVIIKAIVLSDKEWIK